MKVTIINAEPNAGSAFDSYIREYSRHLELDGHAVTRVDLRDIDIRGCSGCWGCWVKTPGECVKSDDSAVMRRAVIGSNLTVLASPMRMGFTNSLLKRAADQLLPLLHPYLEIQGGEMHHRARYAKYPSIGLLLNPGADSDAEDLELTISIWARTARNLKSSLAFTSLMTTPAEEAAHELASVA